MDLSTFVYTTTTYLYVFLGTTFVILAHRSIPLPIYSHFAYLNGGALASIYNFVLLMSTSNRRRDFMRQPKLLDQVRQCIRLKHLNKRTEEAYCNWIIIFPIQQNLLHYYCTVPDYGCLNRFYNYIS